MFAVDVGRKIFVADTLDGMEMQEKKRNSTSQA
jgi:hypothetical protein